MIVYKGLFIRRNIMSSTAAQQWNPVNEDIENDEARHLDEDYAALLWQPLDLEWTKSAMGWIGEISPEEGLDIAQSALAEEHANEIGSDDIDWWDAFGEVEEAAGIEGDAAHEIYASLWGVIKEQSEQQEINTQEWIYTPIINKLLNEGKLIESEARVAKKALSNDTITDVQKIPDDELSAEKKELVITQLKASVDPDKMQKYAENFATDFSSELGNFQNGKGEYLSDTDQAAYEMISVRYITPLEWEITPKQQKISLNTAFESALNNEILGKKFDRNETFKQISKDIRNPDVSIVDRFQAFKDLLSFTSLEQGKWGRQQEIKFRKRIAEKKLIEAWRNEKFAELLEVFKNAKENSPEALEAARELETMRIEANITPWDANLLAWGWEMEIVWDKVSENTRESA